jgi:hypothetical protein
MRSNAEQKRLKFSYRLQFHLTVFEFIAIAQQPRYITTAHSSLCYETMSLRGRGEGGMALLPVLARSRPVDRIRRVGALTISKIVTDYGTPTLSLGWNRN